jgi:hypothetical protein
LFRKNRKEKNGRRSEAEEMIMVFESIGAMVGFSYLIGALNDTFYQ